MSDYGRHHQDADTERLYLDDGMPTDPSMRAPLNRAPRRQVPAVLPGGPPPRERNQDIVVPRYFVEPDEQMDELRQRSLLWAIWRDRLAVVTMMLIIGVITRPVWAFIIEALR